MMRFRMAAACTFAAAALACRALPADEVKGKVKGVDADKHSITVESDAADRTFAVAADAKVVGLVGKKIKKATPGDLAGGLGGVKPGAEVTLTTEAKGGRPEVTQVKVEGLQAPVKKKKKAK